MRVTNLTAERNLLFNVRNIEERLAKLQDQASSLKILSRPQDDPVGTERSLSLNHHLTQSSQYLRNLDRARVFMDEREQALSELTSILERVNELAMTAATATTPQDARDAVLRELAELKDTAADIADRRVEGRQILVGTLPTWEVGEGQTVTVNDLSTLMSQIGLGLDSLMTAITQGDLDATKAASDVVQGLSDEVLAERSQNGAKEARLNILEEKARSLDLEYQKLLSKVEDVDFAQVVTRLKTAELAYEAALSAGARIIQTTLLDHLR